MTTGKNIALTRQTFVAKIICLLFNMLSRFVIAFFFFLTVLLLEGEKKKNLLVESK